MADGKVVIDVILDDGKVAKGVADVDKSIDGLSGTAKRASANIGKIMSALGLAYAAKKGIDLLKDSLHGAFERIDTMEQFQNVMNVMVDDTDAVSSAMKRLDGIVEGTSFRLDVMADGVQNFVTRGMDIDEATDTMEAWGNAVAFYGDGSNEQFQSVTDALQNMVAKGTVGQDQLNRIFEAGIPATEIYADAVGKSTEEVEQALSDGEISAEEFVKVVSDAMMEGTENFPEISNAMEDMGMSWASVLENMGNYVQIGMQDIVEAIDEMLESNGLPDMRTMIDEFGQYFGNVLSSIADKILDFNEVLQEFDSFGEFFIGMFQLIVQELPVFIEGIIGTILEHLPRVMTSGIHIVMAIMEGIVESTPQLIESGTKIVLTILEGINEIFPDFVESLLMLLTELVELVSENIDMFMEMGIDIINTLTEGIIESIDIIIEVITEVIVTLIEVIAEHLPEFIDSGVEILTSVIIGIVESIPELIDTGIELILNLIDAILDNLPQILEAGVELIVALIEGLVEATPDILSAITKIIFELIEAIIKLLPDILSAGVKIVFELTKGILSVIGDVLSAGVDLVVELIKGIGQMFGDILSAGKDLVVEVVSGITGKISDVFNAGKDLAQEALDGVENIATSFFDAGKNIVSSIIDGIKAAPQNITSAIKEMAGAARDFLPFSPAKKGPLKDLDKLDFGGPIEDSLKKAIPNVQAELQALLNIGGPETVLSTPEPSYVDVGGTYEITIVSEIDGKTLAKETVLYTAEELESLKKRDRRR